MSLSSRFPKVMALLMGTAASVESADDDDNREIENAGGEGDSSDEDTSGSEGGEDQGGEGSQDQGDDSQDGGDSGAGANALNGIASVWAISETDRVALLDAFGHDADALVSGERDRCIAVFTSDAGRRNPDGAAAVLRDTTMSAEKANAFLATFGGNKRTDARQRLNSDSSTRVKTGAASESEGNVSEAKKSAKARRQERNKSIKGGKKVNAQPGDNGDD